MSSKDYGVDIALEYNDYWADLKSNSADIATIDGIDNLAQAIRNRLMTTLGDIPRHPTYGSKLSTMIGKRSNSVLDTIIRMMVMESLQDEGRIQLATSIDVDIQDDTINIALYVVSIYSTETAVALTIGGQ